MIKLEDDQSWPICIPCGSPIGWCAHVADRIRNNADILDPENISGPITTLTAVPYLPNQQVFAGVGFDEELAPGTRMLWLATWKPFMPNTEYEREPLGIWNTGERRASLCLTVRDFIQSLTTRGHLKCPFPSHGFQAQALLEKLDDTQLEVNDFYCVTEGCCYFCHQKHGGIDLKTFTGGDNFLDDPDDPNVSSTLTAAKTRLGRS